jgi:two-component system invasion response regulator UvrY
MNILIIEDHPLIVLGVKMIISDFDPQAKIDHLNSFPESLTYLATKATDLIILDIDIPGSENLKMMGMIRELQPNIIILIHSGYDEHHYALPYIQAGADGFLSKQASPDEFTTALKTVLKRNKYVSYNVQQSLLNNSGTDSHNLNLSPGEMRVMQLIIEGKWTKEIASIMNLKQNTVSTYKRRIYDKLGVSDAIELSKKVALLKQS